MSLTGFEVARRAGLPLALLGASMGLVACGNETVVVDSGVVIEKTYEPERLEQVVHTICKPAPNNMIECKPVLIEQALPETFKLTLRDCEQQVDGECAIGEVVVDEVTYGGYDVGDYYQAPSQ